MNFFSATWISLTCLKRLPANAAAFFCVFLLGACSRPSGPEPLRVGMDLSYPPFETIDASGRPTGVSVDLAESLAAALGRPLRIENIPFTGLIPSLKTGQIDCVISSMTDTPERRESISFSEPYLSVGLALLVPSTSSAQGLEDLDQEGRTIVVRQGTTGEVWARANIRAAKILAVEKESAAVTEVLQGKADAFVYDQMSVWKNASMQSGKLKPLLQPLRKESWAVGLAKDNSDLRELINDFLRGFRASGGFDVLGEKYLSDQKQAFREQGLDFYF